jgi:hypothetical chaperone protein
LYDAVSNLKQQLSSQKQAILSFENLSINITRADFEDWIADDINRIETALTTTLDNIAVKDGDIDEVFLTGGTSLVPAVRQLFAKRFGEDRINGGEELISVAKGLTQI